MANDITFYQSNQVVVDITFRQSDQVVVNVTFRQSYQVVIDITLRLFDKGGHWYYSKNRPDPRFILSGHQYYL